jgi:hypothetical protein
MSDDAPVIDCDRIHTDGGDLFVFDCPHCWTYGGSTGCDDTSADYRRRPKRARAQEHVHGAGSGHRVAHCSSPASPFYRTGYILRERVA